MALSRVCLQMRTGLGMYGRAQIRNLQRRTQGPLVIWGIMWTTLLTIGLLNSGLTSWINFQPPRKLTHFWIVGSPRFLTKSNSVDLAQISPLRSWDILVSLGKTGKIPMSSANCVRLPLSWIFGATTENIHYNFPLEIQRWLRQRQGDFGEEIGRIVILGIPPETQGNLDILTMFRLPSYLGKNLRLLADALFPWLQIFH